jgi:CheY-like chemotaxis protein
MNSIRNDMASAATALQGHWLLDVVSRQQLAPPGALQIMPGDDLETSWAAAARASGISQDELATHVATHFGLGAASLAAADPMALRLLSEQLMHRHHVFPLRESKRELVIAVADPTDLSIEEDVAFSSDRRPVLEIAPPVAILEAIRSLMAPSEAIATDLNSSAKGAVTLLEEASVEVADAQEAEFAGVVVRAEAPTPTPTPIAEVKPLILMVDDDAVNRRIARVSLEKAAFRMEESVDGVDAVERLQREPAPDLVILDLQMPRMGGVEVLDWMRKTPATASIPVIVFTAMGSDNESQLMDAGADDYVRKPLDPPRFISRIKAALRRRTY